MPEKLSQGPRIGYDASKVGAGLSRGPFKGKTLPAAPWSGTWPAPGATLDLDFANDRGYVRGVGQGRSMDAVTFTRASLGRYVDQDGILQEAANNQPRFDWASTAQTTPTAGAYVQTTTPANSFNLFQYSEEFNNAAWTKVNATISQDTVGTADPNGGNTADKLIEASDTFQVHFLQSTINTFRSSEQLTISCYIKAAERTWCALGTGDGVAFPGTGEERTAYFDLTNGVVGTKGANIDSSGMENVGNGWYRCWIKDTTTASPGTNGVAYIQTASSNGVRQYNGNGTSGIYIWGAQLERVAATTPLTANPTSNGLLIEESRTNRILWNRDATQAQWVKTDVTAAKDQTGIDGVASAASSLTATADNGTCIQTITLASGSRTGSVYLKRITGTGTVQVSLDGSTWSTVDLSDTEWRRIVLSGTVTNPTVGIKIATNGDAVAMDYAQVEDGAFATTPILTTTATVTRAVDAVSVSTYTNKYWMNQEQGSIFTEFTFGVVPDTNSSLIAFSIDNGSNNWFRISREDGGGSYNRLNVAYRTTIAGSINQSIAGTLGSIDLAVGNVPVKIAINMQPNNYLFYQSNEIGSLLTSLKTPNTVLTKETATLSFSASLNGWYKRFVYFPKTLTENALQELTR